MPEDLPAGTSDPFQEGMPTIRSVAWACDVDAAEWTFEVETERWTGGGRLWMTREHDRVEDHRFYSDEADPDGAWDRLSLELDVATSWQEASGGSSTAWRCADAEDLSFLLVVYGPRGSNEADCRRWGPRSEDFALHEALPACDTLLEEDPSEGEGEGEGGGGD